MHHPWRLCGWLGACLHASVTQDSRALGLWQSSQLAVACTAVELHGCCARVSLPCRGAPQPTQHVDCVTRAGSPSAESRSRARSLVLLTMLAPVVENATARFEDQLQSSTTKRIRKSPTATVRHAYGQGGRAASAAFASGRSASGRRFANVSSVSAVKLVLETMGPAPTPPLSLGVTRQPGCVEDSPLHTLLF